MKKLTYVLGFISSFICFLVLSAGFVVDAADDVEDVSTVANPRVSYMTRDSFYFGSYWQEDTNGDGVADKKDEKTPIRWQVLESTEYDAFIIADRVIDSMPYNSATEDDGACTWETSSIRAWLNDEFLDNAFTKEEQAIIKKTTVKDNGNSSYSSDGGNDTRDKIYLISHKEILDTKYGFDKRFNFRDKVKVAKATDYALNKDGLQYSYYTYTLEPGKMNTYSDGACYWWGRTIGYYQCNALTINPEGSEWDTGNLMGVYQGVRPVMHIKINELPESQLTDPVKVKIDGVKWDRISFGTYNDKPLIWRVLKVDGNEAMLLSEDAVKKDRFDLNLDKYREYYDTAKWDTCTLRQWLNEDFYNEAFSNAEKDAILLTELENKGNSNTGEAGCDNTFDHVYLLSSDDVTNESYGFPKETYVENNYRKLLRPEGEDYHDWKWWLRSPGEKYNTAFVQSSDRLDCFNGVLDFSGTNNMNTAYVRPVINVNLTKLSSEAYEEEYFEHEHTFVLNKYAAPTCTQPGRKGYYECTLCHYCYTTDGEGNKYEVDPNNVEVPATGHTGGTATCCKRAVCTKCRQEYGEFDTTKHGKTEVRNVKEVTCEEDGYTGDTYCKDCNAKIEEGNVIPAEGHTGGTASCCKKAVCERCHQEYGEVDPTNHGETEVRDAVEVTCTEDGYTGNTYCKDCNTKIEEGNVIPAEGHTGGTASCCKKAICERCHQEYGDVNPAKHGATEVRDAVEATCTEDGYSGDTYCKECNEKIDEGEIVPATGHTGGEATCCKKAVCTKCHQEYGELNPDNHSKYTETINKKPATETAEGYSGDVCCKDCGVVLKKGEVIPKLKSSKEEPTTKADSKAKDDSGKTDKQTVTAPDKAKITKLSNIKKNKFLLKFKAKSGASGYEIQYAQNKKFTKALKTVNTKKTKYTAKKLKKKKTYYVRVRAYNLDADGNKIYSNWSAVKKVKIKK